MTSVPGRPYKCVYDETAGRKICERQPFETETGIGLSSCKLNCDSLASLWPAPKNFSRIGVINMDDFNVHSSRDFLFTGTICCSA